MKNILRALTFTLFASAACTLSAAPVCPSTSTTTSDCDYLITISSAGMASVMDVPGSTPFNTMQTFVDGTTDPGGNASLVGVVNNYSQSLNSFVLSGTGASTGIFDFSFNGICVYANAAYCGTAQTGYEGPTTTFTNLMSTIPFEENKGTVAFAPALASGASTYFSLEGAASDLNAHGGLTVSGLSFSPATSAVPEPLDAALLGVGLAALSLLRRRFFAKA